MKYRGVALGVECALPYTARPAWHPSRMRRLITRLLASLKRWA